MRSYANVYKYVFDKLIEDLYKEMEETHLEVMFFDNTFDVHYSVPEVEELVNSIFTPDGDSYIITNETWRNITPQVASLIKAIYKNTYSKTITDKYIVLDFK